MRTESSVPPRASSVVESSQVADRLRTKVIAFAMVAILLVAITVYFALIGTQPQQPVTATAPAAQTPEHMAVAVAQQARLSRLSVVGTIEAGDMVSVNAPFDGVIKERSFAVDTEVEQGQLLLTIDPAELQQRIQEAKVAMLKATKAVQELAGWESSSEVARAKRNFVQAQQQVEQTERKVLEAETLLKKGIIARSEYDGLVEQLGGFRNQLAAATGDLQATQEKASQSNREIARIEYEQAKAKFDELTGSLSLGRIVAPRSGIVSKAQATSGQPPATLDVGNRVAKGQVLFNLALTDKLRIAAKVDEVDITDLIPGMPVDVSIDSQDMPPLHGRLTEVSAQATQSGNGSRSAVFDIKIDIPELNAQQRRRLRVGMSCNVSIETHKAVPPTASGAALSVTRRRDGT